MKVIDPGHMYELQELDSIGGDEVPLLVFVKREGEKYPGNVGSHPGTNLQDVLRVCVDRIKYLDKQVPDVRNGMVIGHLRTALWLLEDRAAERHGRELLNVLMREIEFYEPCRTCGHIQCQEHR